MNDRTLEAPRYVEIIDQELVDELYASAVRLASGGLEPAYTISNAVKYGVYNIDPDLSEVAIVKEPGPNTLSAMAHSGDGIKDAIHLASISLGDIYKGDYMKFTFAKAKNTDGTYGPKVDVPKFHEKISGAYTSGDADVERLTLLAEAIDRIEGALNND